MNAKQMLCVLLACQLRNLMAEYMLLRMAMIGVIIGLFALTKGAPSMMDCFMVGTLLAGFDLVWMLVNWCQRQVDSQE